MALTIPTAGASDELAAGALLAEEGGTVAAEEGGGALLEDAAESCANSFTGDTPVTFSDGSKHRISRVKLGDRVRATDPFTHQTRARRVTMIIVHSGPHTVVDLTLQDGSRITATDHHPFWDATSHTFVYASQLHAGDKLLKPNGDTIRVSTLRVYHANITAYNLTIHGIHTYYAGTTPVLTHNSCSTGLGRIFSEGTNGSVRGRSITSVRATLNEEGFAMSKARGFGYLFENSIGEQVRIMARGGGWDLRAQNAFGNYLNEYGSVAKNAAEAHGISVFP